MSVYKSSSWESCRAKLTQKYSDPGRFYHSLAHVKDCLDQLKMVPDSQCEDRESVELALWFHDVIYESTRTDNESASADFAAEWLTKMNVDAAKIDRVKQLIQITDHRGEPETVDEILIVDIDLSILGREPDVYAKYAAAIRKEYGHVDDEEYREGRTKVLRSFLNREQIFRTAFFRNMYEAIARDNIESEIRELN